MRNLKTKDKYVKGDRVTIHGVGNAYVVRPSKTVKDAYVLTVDDGKMMVVAGTSLRREKAHDEAGADG